MQHKLQIINLSKTYPDGTIALNQLNLEIGNGMFGLLGPNGAGKSTLMKTIATLQEPSEGCILFDDQDIMKSPESIRKTLGYLPQEFGVYPRVSAIDLLEHIAILKGLLDKKERREQIDALLEHTNLYQHRKKYVATFSGGMRQRFGIAQALLGEPKIIIVDEPTSGLDPEERNRFLNFLSEIGENIIVILSTHIVEDVKNLCTNMAIMGAGQILKMGNPLEMTAELSGQIWQKTIAKDHLPFYENNTTLIHSKLIAGHTQIFVQSDSCPGDGFVSIEPGLEEVYFSTVRS